MAGGSPELPTSEESQEVQSADSGMADSMSTGWTDEKHSQYLNSIEASFVNQLYRSEHLSNNSLGWLSRIRKQTSSSVSSGNTLLPGQFKVQRRGCWEKLKFERAERCVDEENQSDFLSANPWIQHFRSASNGKETNITDSKKEKLLHITECNQLDDNEIQSMNLTSLYGGSRPKCSKHLPASCSHLYHQDSVGSNTEVSDQNFIDESESGEEPIRMCWKRRARTVSPSAIKDQVVPSGKLTEPNSDDNGTSPKSKAVVCTSRKLESADGVPCLEAKHSVYGVEKLGSEEASSPV